VDWELVDLSVFFMMELIEVFLPSWSCLGTLGGLALAAGCLTGETDRFLFWLGLAWAWPAVEADLDLAMTASLCFALLAAVLPNRPGEGDRLLVLLVSLLALFPSLAVLKLPPSA